MTHGMHPYPAKFIPHIPRILIESFAPASSVVLDPMCGSGTSLVEATLLGHPAIGIDINPIATLISRAKTSVIHPSGLRRIGRIADDAAQMALCVSTMPTLLEREIAREELPVFLNRDKWFTQQCLYELQYCKRLISALDDDLLVTVAQTAFSAIVVAVSNQESETRWCAKTNELNPGQVLNKFAMKLRDCVSRLTLYADASPCEACVYEADARKIPLDDECIGFAITSPPYASAHDYYLYNKLRMFWLGSDIRSVQQAEIGSRYRHNDKKEPVSVYMDEMQEILGECQRVLIPGGFFAVVVGDAVVHGELHDMGREYTVAANNSGLSLETSWTFDHASFNSAFQRGFGSGHRKKTHVLLLRKR
ncbi:MAG: site-specific DNA-methyltransferase [Coriobacteriia bacterium]|nr:site-specific DNA-methyltransferase [Coriobacteriia bacterium]